MPKRFELFNAGGYQVAGRGNPARLGSLLESWWERLAERLSGETRLPALPAEVSQVFLGV
jgi:hypothetical protein